MTSRWSWIAGVSTLALALLAGCMGDAPKDSGSGAKPAADPWGGSSGSAGSAGSGGQDSGSSKRPNKIDPAPSFSPAGMLGGLAMLSKVGESLKAPGPYEAPTSSLGFDSDKAHWLVLTLSGSIVERVAFSFTGSNGSELREVQERLEELATRTMMQGVLLRFADLELSFPDAIELRQSVQKLRAAGKRVLCHSLGTGNVEYLVMTACERIAIAPLGQIAITGPAAMQVHLRPLLTRFGVVADFLHVGAYKGAAEPFTRDAPSPESNEVLGQILDRHYLTMVDLIAAGRDLPSAQVKQLIDQGLHTPAQAVAGKLADVVAGFEEFRDREVLSPWTAEKLDEDGQLDATDPVASTGKLMQFLGVQPATRPTEPHVAVVYAVGNIVDGGGDGVLGARQEIAASTLVAALRVLTDDESVKAVVLRVDSGGGSAQASELIWQAMAALRAKKPVVVSMSDVAASGGYYISCNANKIYAEADTLTGSIGVVGGKFALGPALAQQGVRTYPVGRGKRATLMASLGAWSAEDRQVIQAMMEDVYVTFVARVAAGRKKSPDDIRAIAEGRVWTGARAKELGLVDELGGLQAAYAEAIKLAGVTIAAPPEIYPPAPTLRDFAVSFGQASLGWGTGMGAELQALARLDPRAAAIAGELLEQLDSFRTSAIQMVTWVPRIR
jgi:protease-4